jgi:hypothetical protein
MLHQPVYMWELCSWKSKQLLISSGAPHEN